MTSVEVFLPPCTFLGKLPGPTSIQAIKMKGKRQNTLPQTISPNCKALLSKVFPILTIKHQNSCTSFWKPFSAVFTANFPNISRTKIISSNGSFTSKLYSTLNCKTTSITREYLEEFCPGLYPNTWTNNSTVKNSKDGVRIWSEELDKMLPTQSSVVFQIQMEMSKQLLIFWLQLWDLLEMKS